MDPITIGLLVGAGMGLLKSAGDKKKDIERSELTANMMRLSPWTKQHTEPYFNQANPMIAEAGQGAMTGLSMGQGYEDLQSDKALRQAQFNALQARAGAPQRAQVDPESPLLGDYFSGENPYSSRKRRG